MLPAEFLDLYRRGDFPHRLAHWQLEPLVDDPVFRAALDDNLGRYDLSDAGSIIDARTDWKGQLMTSFAGVRTNIITVAPGELWGWAGGAVAVAINWKLDRVTTAGIVVGDDVPADSRIPLAP